MVYRMIFNQTAYFGRGAINILFYYHDNKWT